MQLKLLVQQSQNEVFEQTSATYVAVHNNGEIVVFFLYAFDMGVVLQVNSAKGLWRFSICSYLILILGTFDFFHEQFELHSLRTENRHCSTVFDITFWEVSYHFVMAIHLIIQPHKNFLLKIFILSTAYIST